MILYIFTYTILLWKYLFSWKLQNIYRYLRNSNLLHSLTHSLTLKQRVVECKMLKRISNLFFIFPLFFILQTMNANFLFYFYLSHSNEKFDFIAFSGAGSLIWRVENIGFNMPLNACNLWVDFFLSSALDYWEPIDVLFFWIMRWDTSIILREQFSSPYLHYKIDQLFLIQFN